MVIDKKISCKKISRAESPKCESLPIDYEVEGHLIFAPEIGSSMVIARTKRNGVEVPGVMTTSIVQEIFEDDRGLIVKTSNSIYLIKEI